MPDLAAVRFAVLSDLHFGRNGTLSFQGSAQDLELALDTLLGMTELVLLNGDVMDLERGTVPLDMKREWRVVKALHPGLSEQLTRRGTVFLSGNHDTVEVGARVTESATLCGCGYRVRVEHGHRFDTGIKRWRTLTAAVTWASGRAVRLGAVGRGVYGSMRKVESLLTGDSGPTGWLAGRSSVPAGLERRAMRWLLRSDLDGLVIGHTHRPGLWSLGSAWVLNPGASDGPAIHAAVVDLQQRQVEWGRLERGVWTVEHTSELPAPRFAAIQGAGPKS